MVGGEGTPLESSAAVILFKTQIGCSGRSAGKEGREAGREGRGKIRGRVRLNGDPF